MAKHYEHDTYEEFAGGDAIHETQTKWQKFKTWFKENKTRVGVTTLLTGISAALIVTGIFAPLGLALKGLSLGCSSLAKTGVAKNFFRKAAKGLNNAAKYLAAHTKFHLVVHTSLQILTIGLYKWNLRRKIAKLKNKIKKADTSQLENLCTQFFLAEKYEECLFVIKETQDITRKRKNILKRNAKVTKKAFKKEYGYSPKIALATGIKAARIYKTYSDKGGAKPQCEFSNSAITQKIDQHVKISHALQLAKDLIIQKENLTAQGNQTTTPPKFRGHAYEAFKRQLAQQNAALSKKVADFTREYGLGPYAYVQNPSATKESSYRQTGTLLNNDTSSSQPSSSGPVNIERDVDDNNDPATSYPDSYNTADTFYGSADNTLASPNESGAEDDARSAASLDNDSEDDRADGYSSPTPK